MLVALPSAPPADSSPADRVQSCPDLARFTLSGLDLQISRAEKIASAAPGTARISPAAPPVAVAVPAYCLIEGSFERRTGADGKSYALNFALALPDNWNG